MAVAAVVRQNPVHAETIGISTSSLWLAITRSRVVALDAPVPRDRSREWLPLPVERRPADWARGEDFPECPSRAIETLSSSSSVAMVKATNLRQGDNAAEFGWLHRPWFGRVLRQRKVSSRPVVVAKVAV